MAAFRLKLTGLAGSPWGRIYTIQDSAMNRIIAAGRASYGPTLTDQEVAYKMFDGFVQGWLDNAFVHTKDVTAKTAVQGVVKDNTGTVQDDNT